LFVVFLQQCQPTELLRQVNVFTAIISVILLSFSFFSKYLCFLASNAIPDVPRPWRHGPLLFSGASASFSTSTCRCGKNFCELQGYKVIVNVILAMVCSFQQAI
jgi:hypothetical protein